MEVCVDTDSVRFARSQPVRFASLARQRRLFGVLRCRPRRHFSGIQGLFESNPSTVSAVPTS